MPGLTRSHLPHLSGSADRCQSIKSDGLKNSLSTVSFSCVCLGFGMSNTFNNMSEGFLFSLKVPMMYLQGFDEISDRQIVYFPLFLPDVISILFSSLLFISVIFSQLILLAFAMPEFSILEVIDLYIPSFEEAHFANTLLVAPS